MRRLIGVALVVLLAGCGGQEETTFQGMPFDDPGPIHVHGLGLDKETKTLYIATHTGLWQLPEGAAKATRVTDRYQDTMGFTLVRPGLFLGSGHPDLREAKPDVPPLLGLIKSADNGRTWQQISLLGQADFHVLRTAGSRIYGFDSTHNPSLPSSGETVPAVGLLSSRARMERGDVGVDEAGGGAGCGRPRNAGSRRRLEWIGRRPKRLVPSVRGCPLVARQTQNLAVRQAV